MKYFILAILTVTLAVSAIAQYRNDGKTPSVQSRFLNPNNGLFGLLDPNRMQMSQSYTLCFASSGNGSVAQGLYLNNIRYRLSNPLSLNLTLGFLHQPYSSFNGGFSGSSAMFVGSAIVQYRPARNFCITLGINNIPQYNPYYNTLGYFYYQTFNPRPLFPNLDPEIPAENGK
jgi:hypothetical protein